jgi:hypothetical protein
LKKIRYLTELFVECNDNFANVNRNNNGNWEQSAQRLNQMQALEQMPKDGNEQFWFH